MKRSLKLVFQILTESIQHEPFAADVTDGV